MSTNVQYQVYRAGRGAQARVLSGNSLRVMKDLPTQLSGETVLQPIGGTITLTQDRPAVCTL